MTREPEPGESRAVLPFRHHRECMEARLVLEAAGIPTDVRNRDGRWIILVDADDKPMAISELESYERDNQDRRVSDRSRIAVFGGGGLGITIYGAVIVFVMSLSTTSALNVDWSSIGSMRAGDVMSGQWERVLTALTLHADSLHLISNLVFGAVFGFLAGRILGGGAAWLAIVVAGGLGNLMNAFLRDADHTSIGASTAVFAALGILVAHALRPRSSMIESAMKRWSPLIGGVLMFAFVGIGDERTDVLAHATGLVAGMAIGWMGCRIPDAILAHRIVQVFAGIIALGLIATAWLVAVVGHG